MATFCSDGTSRIITVITVTSSDYYCGFLSPTSFWLSVVTSWSLTPGLWGISSQTVEKWKILECKSQEVPSSAIILHQAYLFLSSFISPPGHCNPSRIYVNKFVTMQRCMQLLLLLICFLEKECVCLCVRVCAHTGEGGRSYTLKAF